MVLVDSIAICAAIGILASIAARKARWSRSLQCVDSARCCSVFRGSRVPCHAEAATGWVLMMAFAISIERIHVRAIAMTILVAIEAAIVRWAVLPLRSFYLLSPG